MAATTKKVRALADANILFAGIVFPRWPREVLRHAAAGDFQLVLCPLVIEQARRNLEKRFPEFTYRFEEFVEVANYELTSDPSEAEVEANRHLLRDFDDVPVALAALAARVDYIISEDKDFTTQDETTAELRRFVVPLVSGTFLREVMGWTSEQLEAIRHRKWSDIQETDR